MIKLSDPKVNRLMRKLYVSNDGAELVAYLQLLELDALQSSVTQSDVKSRQMQGQAMAWRSFYESLQTAKS
jgi:hypothetical protein